VPWFLSRIVLISGDAALACILHHFACYPYTSMQKVPAEPHAIPVCFGRESSEKAWVPAFVGMAVGYRIPYYVELYSVVAACTKPGRLVDL
jgi:hypothetical protein